MERLLRLREVIERTGLAKSTIYRNIKAKTFPEPVKVGVASSRWRESDLRDWIARRRHVTALDGQTIGISGKLAPAGRIRTAWGGEMVGPAATTDFRQAIGIVVFSAMLASAMPAQIPTNLWDAMERYGVDKWCR